MEYALLTLADRAAIARDRLFTLEREHYLQTLAKTAEAGSPDPQPDALQTLDRNLAQVEAGHASISAELAAIEKDVPPDPAPDPTPAGPLIVDGVNVDELLAEHNAGAWVRSADMSQDTGK